MINPILASSARRRMRSVRTPIIITLYSALLFAFAFFYSFQDFARPTMNITQMQKGMTSYTLLLALQFALLVLVAPAMTAGSIAGERERQTLDLLKVTNTGAISIVVGKLLESFGFLFLLILSSMPVLSLILVTGGATLSQMLMAVLYLLLVALAALSVGIFASSLFKRTVAATVVSYLSVFGLGIFTLIPLYWDVARIGEIYTTAGNANITLQTIDYVPISFTTNPGLGFFSLIASQGGGGLFSQLLRRFSHTLNVTYGLLPFDRYYVYNMLFLAGCSMVFIGLAAWRVRTDKRDKAPRRGKKA